MSTTLFIVDDDRHFRDVLQELLRPDGGITLVGQAENGEEAIRRTRELHPDVVLMDITMPRVNGFDATRSIKSYRPQTKVIILTVHADYTYEQAALGNGADAFIAKKRLSSDLLPTIHGLMALNKGGSALKIGPSDAVLVVDTDSRRRGRTVAYLRANMSMVIEECANASSEEFSLTDGTNPNVVVVAIEDDDGVFLCGLRGRFPSLGIIALTPGDFSRITESSLVAGADACVARNRIDIELIPAITALVSTHPNLAHALDVTGEG